ncbi:DUF7560 family zinc ribbon protein [Halobiforma nitratireducens]|uniref:Small CPxCG-related zinc finger protein n=1 Tax=Halobiforma nitratireducens JCM 10879 TaxID=1227454 RepID=M0LLS4_9EURY|nr:hypothetical protein [Halobiforma nitratireducens]EMA33419.1 hypothetical protein C446_14354 [Halobiforma nitratireducens JCM 10879]
MTPHEHEFTCSDCGRAIPVTEAMLEATLRHGCPVCGATVEGGKATA